MKILYAGKRWDQGDPNRGLSFDHANFYCTLTNMDVDITYYDCLENTRKLGKRKMNQRLWETVVEEKPDLLFCILMRDEFDPGTIERISQETSTITYNWFCDDHWRYDNYSKYWAPKFNWVSTTDDQSMLKYRRDGYQTVIKTQWGENPFLYLKKELPVKYDVTFIGQVHSNRKKLVKNLEKQGVSIRCFGSGWPEGRVSQETMIDIFNQSKINLNFNNSSTNKWFRFWKKDREQIKGRNFEVPGTGGFLLTGLADNLERYFDLDREIGIYHAEEDISERIQFYLSNDEKRTNIAAAGYERCQRDHSYVERFEEIFARIFG